jgi:ribosomal protein L16 Arg81 hydroxylase
MAPQNLPEILSPFSEGEFFQRYWSRNFLTIGGSAGKFCELLSWEGLNAAVRQHRLSPPRLRLAKGGKILPAAEYTKAIPDSRSGGQILRPLPAAMSKLLRQGATLILDAVNEIFEPIRAMAESLEYTFHEQVQVNAYAAWGETHGFDTHWDKHDVFILQVAGRKHWKVYPQTRKYPLLRDIVTETARPRQPVWEGELKDGDVLYMPKGWWHVAHGLGGPTIHLTVGFNNRTGIDFLNWLVDRCRRRELCRMDLPRFSSREEMTRHTQLLRSQLLEEFDGVGAEQYLLEHDARALPRPYLALPASLAVAPMSQACGVGVRWITPRPVALYRGANDQIELYAHGKRFRFAKTAGPILTVLIDGRPHDLKEILAKTEGLLPESTVRTFLEELFFHGLVTMACG